MFKAGAKKNSGFILVVVLWGVGIISLMALTTVRSADTYAKIVANNVESDRVDRLSEALINIAIFHLLEARRPPIGQVGPAKFNGSPTFCALPYAVAGYAIEDESGKIDINAAPAELLAALFVGAGASENQAATTAAAIIDFRSAANIAQLASKPHSNVAHVEDGAPAKHSLFESALELQQVPYVSSDLFQVIRPFVTVYSHSPGIDPEVALPTLVSMLATSGVANQARGRDKVPQEFTATSTSNSFLIRAEVLGLHNSISVQEAVLEFPYEDPQNLQIREWRKAASRMVSRLHLKAHDVSLPPC